MWPEQTCKREWAAGGETAKSRPQKGSLFVVNRRPNEGDLHSNSFPPSFLSMPINNETGVARKFLLLKAPKSLQTCKFPKSEQHLPNSPLLKTMLLMTHKEVKVGLSQKTRLLNDGC